MRKRDAPETATGHAFFGTCVVASTFVSAIPGVDWSAFRPAAALLTSMVCGVPKVLNLKPFDPARKL